MWVCLKRLYKKSMQFFSAFYKHWKCRKMQLLCLVTFLITFVSNFIQGNEIKIKNWYKEKILYFWLNAELFSQLTLFNFSNNWTTKSLIFKWYWAVYLRLYLDHHKGGGDGVRWSRNKVEESTEIVIKNLYFQLVYAEIW